MNTGFNAIPSIPALALSAEDADQVLEILYSIEVILVHSRTLKCNKKTVAIQGHCDSTTLYIMYASKPNVWADSCDSCQERSWQYQSA